MTATLIDYARCSTDAQDLTAQRQASPNSASPPTASTWTRG
ncbi:MAG TPA: hypothetical protein VGN37_21845 [Actinocatenispora sp.]